MSRIGLAGLFLCLGMVGGVRGQEVITISYFSGYDKNQPIIVSENQVIEILSLEGDSISLVAKHINWSPELNGFSDLSNPARIAIYPSSPKPAILVGPLKFWIYDFYGMDSYALTYRLLPKAGYSPNISPTSLASNTNFVSGLTQTILSTSNSYGLASRTELIQALAESLPLS